MVLTSGYRLGPEGSFLQDYRIRQDLHINPEESCKCLSDDFACHLRPIGSIERTVTNGFRDVIGIDHIAALQVSDGAADFQNPIVGTRR